MRRRLIVAEPTGRRIRHGGRSDPAPVRFLAPVRIPDRRRRAFRERRGDRRGAGKRVRGVRARVGVRRGWDKTTRGADVPHRESAPREGSARVSGAGLHAGRAQLVQVHPGRRGKVLRPLFAFRRLRLFLALLYDGEACHYGREGNQSDTQCANKPPPVVEEDLARRTVRPAPHSARSVPNDRSYSAAAAATPFVGPELTVTARHLTVERANQMFLDRGMDTKS